MNLGCKRLVVSTWTSWTPATWNGLTPMPMAMSMSIAISSEVQYGIARLLCLSALTVCLLAISIAASARELLP